MTHSAATDRDLSDLFAAIDANDAAAFVGFLTDDAAFRFGSAPAVEAFFDSIKTCSHTLTSSFGRGSTHFCEGETTYTRHDGSQVTVPFADVFEYDGDLISQYKIYADIAPLYAT